jgi:hypothetical protein
MNAPIDGHYTKSEALVYANRIRNVFKRAYAYAWIAYRFEGGSAEPDVPPELSFMGAQAVRLTIGHPPKK